MTGDNLADRDDFQQAFWPSEWKYEQQWKFGSLDAPDLIPAGAAFKYALSSDDFLVAGLPVSRGFQ